MRSWGDSRTCRASVIRDILRGRLAADPDPHGLRLRGARITGRLDLENLTTDVNLELKDCLLEEGILARDAHLASVGLIGCQLEHPAEPPLDADRLTCSVLDLTRARIIGHGKRRRGPPARCPHRRQPRLRRGEPAQRLRPRPGRRRPEVGQDMFLSGGFTATGAASGAVRLTGAHIGGSLDCDGASCATTPAPPWSPTACRSTRACFSGGFTATGAATRRGPPGRRPHRRPARLHRGEPAQRLRPRPERRRPAGRPGHVPPRRVHRHRQRRRGAVRLVGAHIGGHLDCTGASLRNDSGPALVADGLQVGQVMSSRGGFTATGSGGMARSACSAPTSAAASTATGRACATTPAPPWSPTACKSARTCSSAAGSPPPAARERRGQPDRRPHRRQLDCDRGELRNDSGPALTADSLQVGQDMFLTRRVHRHRRRRRCGGRSDRCAGGWGAGFDPARLEHTADPHRRLAVDGLTYAGVPQSISARDWLDLLRDGTPSYAAQPYQQLAAGYRALGDERQARKILMAQRDDQLARTDTALAGAVVGQDHQGHPRLWLPALAGTAVPRRGGGRVLRACGRCSARMVRWRKPARRRPLAGRARWSSRSAWDWISTCRWAPAWPGRTAT